MEDKRQFVTYLTALAAMVPSFTLTKEIILMFEEVAQKFGFLRGTLALKQIISERTSRDPFPSVSDFIGRIEFNHLDAEEISAKIFGSVAKFGPYRGSDAAIYLGPIAWNIVGIEGGWESLCQMTTYENAPVLQAQWRKLAAIMIQRQKIKTMDEIGYFSEIKSLIAQQAHLLGKD